MHVLLIEDNEDDACLIREALALGRQVGVTLIWADRHMTGMVSRPKPIRILLVEDETMIRNILRETLIRQGYEVVEAASGSEALARIKTDKRPVALLISDIKLDGINGLELGQRVKMLQPTMKELYISDYSVDFNTFKDRRISTLNFLPKPFTPSTLISKIEEVLSSE